MIFVGADVMSQNYYLTRNGRLIKKNNSLQFKNKATKKNIPINDIDTIYLLGRTSVNSNLLDFLAKKNICLHFFNYYGFYSGTYYPRKYLLSGDCLVKQVKHYLEPVKRLEVAKEFVRASYYGMYKNLKRGEKRLPELNEDIEAIKVYKPKIEEVKAVDELMGIEGNIRKNYYRSFEKIMGDKFALRKRVIRPPDNMINCLVSFGNTLVYTEVLSQIYRTHLDPTVSFLHEPGIRKRFSLSLDIAEIFKPIITDRIIFKLVNNKMIKDSDFDKKLNFCYLNDSGKKKFLQEFDKSIKSTHYNEKLKRNVSMKKSIRIECYKLEKHFIEGKKYKALRYQN
jgi:CRISP-associated protein Cas1